MAAKKLFTQIFIYFSKPLRLLYSLIIYEIVNFSFFTLYSLLLLSFFLYLKSVPIYVIVHVCYCLLFASPIVETVGTEGDTEDDVIADGHLQPLNSGDDDDEE